MSQIDEQPRPFEPPPEWDDAADRESPEEDEENPESPN